MNRITLIWNYLRATFWFLPSLIVSALALAAIFLIRLDTNGYGEVLPDWPLLFQSKPEGARVMLSTIATSMMTVVGVIYSMILVTLSLAASQYSSRIIHNFMRDRATQVVLGVYTGIFVYCLFVLRVIPSNDGTAFVPTLSVTFGVMLAIGGVGVLIYFIHHIAAAIQASSVIEAACRETLAAIDRGFPLPENASSFDPVPEHQNYLWHPVQAERHGYIQSVNTSGLISLASESKTIIRMERAIGDFVVPGSTIASIACDPRPSDELASRIRRAYSVNSYRTVEQDPAFGIQQIVDIALRALSPGVNDTNTASMCVHQLSACLARLAVRADPPRSLPVEGPPRLLCNSASFHSLLDAAVDPIRESAEGNAAIIDKLTAALRMISKLTADEQRVHDITLKIEDLAETTSRSIRSTTDRERLQVHLAAVRIEIGVPDCVDGSDREPRHKP